MIEVTQQSAPSTENNEKKPKAKTKLTSEKKIQRRGTVVYNFKPAFFKLQKQKTNRVLDKPSPIKTSLAVVEKTTRKTLERL